MNKKAIVIHWFRQDLRLSDNPAFNQAVAAGQVLPIYILDDENAGLHAMGGASRWWLHYSLECLNQSLSGKLNIYRANSEKMVVEIAKRHGAQAVYWNRCYEPWRIKSDTYIKEKLRQEGIKAKSFNGYLLWEPWDIKKKDGTPYRVFTPFYRKGCLGAAPPRKPLECPKNRFLMQDLKAMKLLDLNLLPKIRWDKKLEQHCNIGEAAAESRLRQFLEEGIADYKEGRNFPYMNKVSRLSAHLHFGEISPNQVWYAVRSYRADDNSDHFCSELGWREFAHHLLYQFPNLAQKNLQSKFDLFPWQTDPIALERWQNGLTGYPIVDAGMRELWQTGTMQNRVRMITGSFLVKNLLIDWRHGERWFWNCLVDANLANNSAGWQWIAGCGADAAPYFRIFNPVTQGEKFDPGGHYVRRFVPELSNLPDRYLFKPWEAPPPVLQKAGVILGKNYPEPMVDLSLSRMLALQAFARIK